MIDPRTTDIVGVHVRLVNRADPSNIKAYGVVRVVDYNQGAFALLIEAVGDSSWYSLSDGELFQISMFDETTAVVIDNNSQAVHGTPESSGPHSRISTGFPGPTNSL